jgi:hypothetical protein
MIIGHKYRYLFIEIPLTGSWSIHNELCEYYGGESILHKHASYPEFLREASEDELGYFVFATVRNPLDVLVSRYFKLKENHKGTFTRSESIEALKIDYSDIKKFNFIKKSNASFEEFFIKCYRWPFSDMIDMSADQLDFVIRFENLQEDFSKVMGRLRINQVRPLPVSNVTQGRRRNWRTYYTPRTIEQAKKICGPYMNEWGYEFPQGWGDYRASSINEMEYKLVCLVRNYYLIHFRYNDKFYSKFLRYVRAKLLN